MLLLSLQSESHAISSFSFISDFLWLISPTSNSTSFSQHTVNFYCRLMQKVYSLFAKTSKKDVNRYPYLWRCVFALRLRVQFDFWDLREYLPIHPIKVETIFIYSDRYMVCRQENLHHDPQWAQMLWLENVLGQSIILTNIQCWHTFSIAWHHLN